MVDISSHVCPVRILQSTPSYQPASVGPRPSQVQRGATQLDIFGNSYRPADYCRASAVLFFWLVEVGLKFDLAIFQSQQLYWSEDIQYRYIEL